MSLLNSNKTLIGTAIRSIDENFILGQSDSIAPLVLLGILIDSLEYATAQYNSGNSSYQEHISTLNAKILELRHKCPAVCLYKDKIVIANPNTPPVIEDNTIELIISNDCQELDYSDVVYNYFDEEGDRVCKVIVISNEEEAILTIEGDPLNLNFFYDPEIGICIKYEAFENIFYITENIGGDPCTANIIATDQEDYENASGNVLNINETGSTTFQDISSEIEELPNDTIIYVHIDTSSMAVSDQQALTVVVLDWWTSFQNNNPTFEGSLLINTIPNNQISNDYAPGRGGLGKTSIGGSTIQNGNVEDWLQGASEALLRQHWKEGGTNFPNETAFQNYIANKSVVVLSFVDESRIKYHDTAVIPSFSSGNVTQPSSFYVNDYLNFVYKVRPFLRSFKGILYPISVLGNPLRDNFILHGMAAIEGTTLTPTQIDTLLGPDKVAFYGTDMQSHFYDNLGTVNPYSPYGQLKALGWEGNFTKYSPALDVFSSEEFAQELDELLTGSVESLVTEITTENIDSQNLGPQVTTCFELIVKDDNSLQPLYSNPAKITVNFNAECEKVPECGERTEININHLDTYTFIWSDFTAEPTVDKIRITSFAIGLGQLKLYNLILNGLTEDLIITKDLIDAGALTYSPDTTVQTQYGETFFFKTSYQESINYCEGQSSIALVKLENPNNPPIIAAQDQVINTSGNVSGVTTTIPGAVTYNGQGNYDVFWTKISGPVGDIMTNPTAEDLVVTDLNIGVYVYRITVITEVDNFIVQQDITITVN